MPHVIGKTFVIGAMVACLGALLPHSTHAMDTQISTTRHVDLAIALDVSGSMDGLIESAKQRLWDIINELGRAEPSPQLRVAVLSYGNPDYGRRSGYVRVDQPFTRDLDAVNQALFAFGTNGGDEYVARAVHVSVNQLQWSNQPDALRIIFVAGNESAEQDPQIRIEQAIELATDKDIFVNTIAGTTRSKPPLVGKSSPVSLAACTQLSTRMQRRLRISPPPWMTNWRT